MVEIALKGPRKAIAAHMMQSLSGTAQLSFHAECDVTDLVARRAAWKAEGRGISMEDCLIAAYADALAAHPECNGRVGDDAATLLVDADIAIAVSAHGLLLTPVVRAANRLSLGEIGARRRDLVARARSGDLRTSELIGAGATLSNLGTTVVCHFTPILNKAQLTLLGAGRTRERLQLDQSGRLEARLEMGLSLTVDHRFIDGEPAARLLGTICRTLSGLADDR